MKTNINKTALRLAHSLKGVYSSFRVALIMAYKLLKSTTERDRVLNALITVSIATFKLGMTKKYQASLDAWFAIWNLTYLD